jgi:hypothetical protein
MTKLDRQIAEDEARLALRKAERDLIAKKKAGKLTNKDRLALRGLRRAYREDVRTPTTEGAAPAAIGTKTEIK